MIWYSEDHEKRLATKVYHTYASDSDMTFIFVDVMHLDEEKWISTEVKGFYYGEPSDELTEEYFGSLKVEY